MLSYSADTWCDENNETAFICSQQKEQKQQGAMSLCISQRQNKDSLTEDFQGQFIVIIYFISFFHLKS